MVLLVGAGGTIRISWCRLGCSPPDRCRLEHGRGRRRLGQPGSSHAQL